jgi:tRNA (guanine37-N1)-methyltransferase
MKIDILTLFPEIFQPILDISILGRAQKNNIIQFQLHNIRDFARNKHKQVDDYSYGGGSGMVLSPQPLFDALSHLISEQPHKPKVIYFSPQGKVLNQQLAKEYARQSHLVLLCGHYEGLDQRVIDNFVDQEISIGDYVLTGGELPAMVFIDCISRLIPGVLGNEASLDEESFSKGLLEYPQYTRPQDFEGHVVPKVLLSGNHHEISQWRKRESLRNTLVKRPDLLKGMELTPEEKEMILDLKNEIRK